MIHTPDLPGIPTSHIKRFNEPSGYLVGLAQNPFDSLTNRSKMHNKTHEWMIFPPDLSLFCKPRPSYA